MSRHTRTYRANGNIGPHLERRYVPATKSGKEWPAEQKGRQEAARRLRQMEKIRMRKQREAVRSVIVFGAKSF